MSPLRVLYVHVTGPFGGSSRSLVEAVQALPPGAVRALFLTQRGGTEAYFSKVGEVEAVLGVTKFDHTRYSHYRGLRWLVVLRELAYLPSTWLGLWRARRRWGEVDLIHLNEFTGVFALSMARWLFRAPAVIHVRSLVEADLRLARTRWMHSLLRAQAQALVAIDESVRGTLPGSLAVNVIHNAFTSSRAADADDALEQGLSRLSPHRFKIGFVGNLLLVKGILDLLEAARLLKERGLEFELVVVGDDASPSGNLRAKLLKHLGLAQSMRKEVEATVQRHGLSERVHLIGFTPNIGRAYQCMDLLCFPSHYDAPGRPVFEAAFFGVPSVVAVRNPKPDTVVHGITGLAVPPRDPRALADAIAAMAANRDATRRMGVAARTMAENNFSAQRNARSLLDVYEKVVAGARAP
jgi:glycosyltransferase involved in cell wall biosynthesis